jgi:hypothetical protein
MAMPGVTTTWVEPAVLLTSSPRTMPHVCSARLWRRRIWLW